MTTFKLFPAQLKALQSPSKLTLMVSGRGFGKSTVAGHWLLKQLVDHPKVVGFAGSPTYAQTYNLATKFFTILNELGISYTFNKAPPWKTLFPSHGNLLSVMLNGTPRYIKFGSLDNYEAHRGWDFAYLLIDEAALVEEEAYTAVLLPALRGAGPTAKYPELMLTTPRGAGNWISQILDRKDASIIKAKSEENFYEFPPAKLELYKEIMTERLYKQEMEAEILAINDARIIYAFNSTCLTNDIPTQGQLYLASDQNNSPLCALLIRAGTPDVIVKEIVIPDSANVNELVKEITRANPKKESLILTGDRSGNNKTLVSNLTFYQQLIDQLRKAGIGVVDKTNNKNPSIFESAELTNKQLELGKLKIHNKCVTLIEELEKAVYKPGDFATDKKVIDPHLVDCLRYYAWTKYYSGATKILLGN